MFIQHVQNSNILTIVCATHIIINAIHTYIASYYIGTTVFIWVTVLQIILRIHIQSNIGRIWEIVLVSYTSLIFIVIYSFILCV